MHLPERNEVSTKTFLPDPFIKKCFMFAPKRFPEHKYPSLENPVFLKSKLKIGTKRCERRIDKKVSSSPLPTIFILLMRPFNQPRDPRDSDGNFKLFDLLNIHENSAVGEDRFDSLNGSAIVRLSIYQHAAEKCLISRLHCVLFMLVFKLFDSRFERLMIQTFSPLPGTASSGHNWT